MRVFVVAYQAPYRTWTYYPGQIQTEETLAGHGLPKAELGVLTRRGILREVFGREDLGFVEPELADAALAQLEKPFTWPEDQLEEEIGGAPESAGEPVEDPAPEQPAAAEEGTARRRTRRAEG